MAQDARSGPQPGLLARWPRSVCRRSARPAWALGTRRLIWEVQALLPSSYTLGGPAQGLALESANTWGEHWGFGLPSRTEAPLPPAVSAQWALIDRHRR